jgi:ribosomal protein S24E
MNIEITKQERNDLLERDELELAIDHTGDATPSENDVRNKLAAEQDLDPETIHVDHIYSDTGRGTATGVVQIYDEPVVELDEDSEEPTEDADADEESADEAADDVPEEEASTDEEEVDDADETDDTEEPEEDGG